MKKRIVSLLLALILCLMLPAANAFAADEVKGYAATEAVGKYSNWAIKDLVTGSTYGIYPSSWELKDMTAPITQGQLRNLIAGLRNKILETDCVTKNPDNVFYFNKKITVENVLETFYKMLTDLEFKSDIGIAGKKAVEFMKSNGIYTGKNGEQKLTDTCSMEQACAISIRLVTYLYDKLDAASKGFLWVTKSGGNTVYMLGSIHMASTKIYPMSKEIINAFQSSDVLVEEVNLFDTTNASKFNALGIYTDGTKLKNHISEETYKKVIKLGEQFGLTESALSNYKPWYLYASFNSLAFSATSDQAVANQAVNLGIDINLLTNAYLLGKPIMEVEGYEYQGKVLDSFSEELQEKLLNETLDQVNEGMKSNSNDYSEYMDIALKLWHDGDVNTFLENTSEEDEYPEMQNIDENDIKLSNEFKDKLLTQRDKGMADYIDKLLKAEGNKTYFVVVGSAHYISDHSVLNILQEKGYTLTQIK